MLRSVELDDKSYEELMEEAIGRIPLYSEEWTNFNRSDPGVTVLQNLTAFNHLQQMQLDEVSEAVRLRLLGLLGFTRGRGRPARLCLEAKAAAPLRLPAHSSFSAGDVQFEAEGELLVEPWGIEGAVAVAEGHARDITALLDREVAAGAMPFGKQPVPGAALWLFLGGRPAAGRPLILWAEVEGSGLRNPQSPEAPVELATLAWEMYTEAGWQPLAAEDDTCGFIQSGAIRLPPPAAPPAQWQGEHGEGYALRCTLQRAEYDLPAKLKSLSANLFEVWQKRSCAAVFHAAGGPEVRLRSRLAALGNLFVYCREEGPASPYRAYRQVGEELEITGRFFSADIAADGSVTIRFNRQRYGHAPAEAEGCVMVLCYDDAAVLGRGLGQVYGYEDQPFELPHLENLLEEGFLLLAEEQDAGGEPYYYLVEPNQADDPDAMHYTLECREGRVLVRRPAIGGTCYLYLAACATSLGAEGCIREGNRFAADACLATPAVFENPGPGEGGTSEESAEALRRRFLQAMRRPSTAVTAADYEALVQATPGLCIHRVKALADEAKNTVQIAVKPHAPQRWPVLTPLYMRHIARHLEARRMVNTRVSLVQPQYVDIDVKAAVQVRSYATGAREEIEAMLLAELDFAASRDFGEVIRFHELFSRLEQLDCVQAVRSLTLIPRERARVQVEGPDIRLAFNCFARPGQLMLELVHHD